MNKHMFEELNTSLDQLVDTANDFMKEIYKRSDALEAMETKLNELHAFIGFELKLPDKILVMIDLYQQKINLDTLPAQFRNDNTKFTLHSWICWELYDKDRSHKKRWRITYSKSLIATVNDQQYCLDEFIRPLSECPLKDRIYPLQFLEQFVIGLHAEIKKIGDYIEGERHE